MEDVVSLWCRFKNIVEVCVHRFVPLSIKKKKCNNPWISHETLRLQRKLKRVKKKLKIENVQLVKQNIDDISSQPKSQVHADKQPYYHQSLPCFITTAPEKLCRSISPNSKECVVHYVDGKAVHESKEIANAFNKHFNTFGNVSATYTRRSNKRTMYTKHAFKSEH